MLLGRLGKVMFLLGFGEQVRVRLFSGFVKQTSVVFVRLMGSNTLTEFW